MTGHDANGKAIVVIDDAAPHKRSSPSGNSSSTIWCSDAMPADIAIGTEIEDMGARKIGTPPPPSGTRFTINEIMPGSPPVMHRTETLDYAVVLEGEIEMELDDSTVTLQAGDVVVQRGTNHAWANRSNAPVRMAFVLVDAEPLGIGEPVQRGASPKPPSGR